MCYTSDMMEGMELIGVIVLKDALRIGDPCFDLDVWCAGQVCLRRGKYECFIGYTPDRKGVRALGMQLQGSSQLPTQTAPFVIGVDSGQCGFYDLQYYCRMRQNENYPSWYSRVIELTQEPERMGGILDGCALVSRSGGGDGTASFRYAADEFGCCTALLLEFEV
ncbi:MAG: hypothetical protein Q4C04_02510 [Clostridia bacterium]|nr:hypothetical protein [Clostridia bacterium]